ncbi:uncharacterized protein LOC126380709 [Pectinophora gossypiella]|uniref:uncharacterized protein LOC126380709 n=1 Tax=Pectinophora gossypiella TaxID=13191 RepID=UPI00214E3C0B|nr:uncharacterized protein LOC126380709 [Pectinophora gossypiella]
MAHFKAFILSILILCLTTDVICKIVLPHKLRYLENMLNSEVVAKAAKIRQRIESNPNAQENDKSWPVLLAKYGQDEKKNMPPQPYNNYNNMYGRRIPNFK